MLLLQTQVYEAVFHKNVSRLIPGFKQLKGFGETRIRTICFRAEIRLSRYKL